MSSIEALQPVVDDSAIQSPPTELEPSDTIQIAEPSKEEEELKDNKMSEGVEVVLDNNKTVVDAGHLQSDQNVFRGQNPVRPRAVRAQGGAPPHVKASASYGYAEYGHGGPYPSAYSASFDEGAFAPSTASHYSPHVQYPPPGRGHAGDINVISPHHKEHGHRPPMTPSRRGHQSYHYPPTSPVSRPAAEHSPPRMRGYAMRRPEGPYSAAQRSRSHPPSRHPEDGAWRSYPSPDRSRPPIVAETSFDSEHYSSHASHASHPATPNAAHYGPPMHHERAAAHQQAAFYGSSFGGSFDSPAPGYYEQRGYYGHSPYHHPESPSTPYSRGYPGYSPGSYHDNYSPHSEYGRDPRSYDHDDYHHGHPHFVSPKTKDSSGMMLPKAAQEIDFDVTDPPMEPITQPSKIPLCPSPADVNAYDVLCGRGGGTNSQIGNRRFRQLVQEFQPTYLLARRKEKPLLARTIVLIIRKRGGRFLKKDDETGELFEVGDAKAEAKTSQALREGLDVRATKSAASSLMDKKKKNKTSDDEEKDHSTPNTPASHHESPVASYTPSSEQKSPTEATLSLPRLNENHDPPPCPPSPNSTHFRKRRRMRSAEGSGRPKTAAGCGMGFQDKLFPDFCPPRADIGRVASPTMHDMPQAMDMNTPTRSMKMDDDIYAGSPPPPQRQGCAGIALDVITGAAAGSFCLGPRKWR